VRGLLTDHDIVVRAIASGRDGEQTHVSDVCSSDLQTLSPDEPVERAVEEMRRHSVRRMPVVQGNKAVGILSLGDLAMERDERSALADISAASPNR
jgi:CBS domain-containing protein